MCIRDSINAEYMGTIYIIQSFEEFKELSMRTALAIFAILLIGAVFSQETCVNKVFHLIDRAQNHPSGNPNYQQMFAYFEDRLLHNKSYTYCFNYTNEFCQFATTRVLPPFFHYIKDKVAKDSQAATAYYYVKAISIYFLQKCGRGIAPKPKVIDKDEFNNAICKNASLEIYALLTSKDRIDGTLDVKEYETLFDTFRSMFKKAHERSCFIPDYSIPRVFFNKILEGVPEVKQDRRLLSDLWMFISYLGVEYLKDAGLNQKVMTACDNELKQLHHYLSSDNGFNDYNAFVFFFNTIHNQTRCFKCDTECNVYANKLYETSLNTSLVPKTANEFLQWWDVIKFNLKHYIHKCYLTPTNDTNSTIWKNTYTSSNNTCTVRVNDIIQVLGSNEIEAIRNINVTGPSSITSAKSSKTSGTTALTRTLTALSGKRQSTTSSTRPSVSREDNLRTTRKLEILSTPATMSLSSTPLATLTNAHPPPPITEVVNCSSYLEALGSVIRQARGKSSFSEATTLMSQNKILLNEYEACDKEKKSKLCSLLFEQFIEIFYKTIFTNEVDSFKNRLIYLQDALIDITEECRVQKVYTQGTFDRSHFTLLSAKRQVIRMHCIVSSEFITVLYLSLIHISEPTRRTPISYAVFCLKKKKKARKMGKQQWLQLHTLEG
eukprot:TRINITY_DN234_c0_g1_i6.p1 TRINITY_DN234_c0_g1~~TRINITY_DN234_c0_g1_i6.p1  ORF type:complete len:662 (-),score=162.63 TRINITY_DN234_c0_g1_i6:27-2012(-)